MNAPPTTDVLSLLFIGACALCLLALMIAGALLLAFARSAGRGLIPLVIDLFSARERAEEIAPPPVAQPNLNALAHNSDFEARLARKIAEQQSASAQQAAHPPGGRAGFSAPGAAPRTPAPPLQGPPTFEPRTLPGARTPSGPPPPGDDLIAGVSDDLGL
jgi:hypothetical protein